jgi:hypothetical protein
MKGGNMRGYNVTIYANPIIWARVRSYCAARGIGLSRFCMDALSFYLDRLTHAAATNENPISYTREG